MKLLANVAEDVTVASGKSITLDLNGFKITNVSSHTVTNNGTLTITDSSESKTGTIDNLTHAKAAVENSQGATCTIESAKITRSQEAGSSASSSGGNSYYYIENFGTMTIGADNSTVAVGSDGHFSSLVHNGWYDGSKNASSKEASMTINAGTFKGGLNTIKNDDWGVITINGGDFQNSTQASLFNVNKATVNGGSFESTTEAAVYTRAYDQKMDWGITEVHGGTFKSAGSTDLTAVSTGSCSPTITVDGGTFSKDPSSYVASGYAATLSSDGNYAVAKKAAEEKSGDNSGSTQTSGVDVSNSTELAKDAVAAAEAVKDINVPTIADGEKTATTTIGGSTVEVNEAQKAALESVKDEAAKDGASVNVNLVVKADTNVEANEAITAKANGAGVIPFALSVDMVTTVKSGDEVKATASLPVTQTASAIQVTIAVDPSSILNKRVSVARNHNDVVDILSADVNYETGAVTFSTDKFSDYALITVDANKSYKIADYTNVDGSRKAIVNSDFNISDDYAFAGWYTDSALTIPYTSESTAEDVFPAFVKISDLIQFKGGSLRMDQDASEGTSLRFGYETSVPSGASLTKVSWNYNLKGSNSSYSADMTNYLINDDSITANIVLTGAKPAAYQSVICMTETLEYRTADGTNVSVSEASAHERSVAGVAQNILDSGYALDADKTYAQKIIDTTKAS